MLLACNLNTLEAEAHKSPSLRPASFATKFPLEGRKEEERRGKEEVVEELILFFFK